MYIGGLQKTTFLDYPGKLACIIFTNGCNFRCGYCHNPELIRGETQLDVDSIFTFLHKRKGKLDGVVVTGGEPTIHSDLPQFLHEIKKLGYCVKLDTNGSQFDTLQLCLPYIDYIAMDIKGPLHKYVQITNSFSDITSNIVKSIELLINGTIDYEFRTTVLPSQLQLDDFDKINKLISGAKLYYLQRFLTIGNILDDSFVNRGTYKDFTKIIDRLPDIHKVEVRQ